MYVKNIHVEFWKDPGISWSIWVNKVLKLNLTQFDRSQKGQHRLSSGQEHP